MNRGSLPVTKWSSPKADRSFRQPKVKRAGDQSVPNGISGAKQNATTIAQFLSYALHQPVVDKTGLTGSYDIKLSYAPLNDPNATSNNPDIFTAVQEQLGPQA